MIRPARPTDVESLRALQSHLAAPAPELLASFEALGTCLVSVAGFASADGIARRSTGGITGRVQRGDSPCPGGQPVGYALLLGDAHLAELVVHPAHRREGRGRALLGALIEQCDPGSRVTLTVAEPNEAARSLYESMGFEVVGHLPEFYEIDGCEDPIDAVAYAYKVPSAATTTPKTEPEK